MKRLRHVTAADENPGSEKLMDTIDALKDDFDFIVSGLEKLDRTGASESNDALIIAESLGDSLQNTISQISDKIG